MAQHNSIEDRISYILKGGTLSLAIEGKYTNLRIWTGVNANGVYTPEEHDTIFMRLDRANHYSVPLGENTFYLLETDKGVDNIRPLLVFGFTCSIDNLNKILNLTQNMPERICIEW